MNKAHTSTNSQCSKCGHVVKGHEFNVLGQTLCPSCPEGKCTEKAEQLYAADSPMSMGFLTISDMGKEHLIEEIMLAQRKAFEEFPIERLRRMVAELRIAAVKQRLYTEAAVDSDGFFGWM